jgi:transposase InsO family protein
MFHLGHAKVAERLAKSYFWPDLRGDTRRILTDCPTCELDKARRNEAHGLFRALPTGAPRAQYAMDFQGQGKAVTGECEALAFIDLATRYVTVIALPDRKVQNLVPAFLDHVVFQHGPPEALHSDEAPEFMSALMQALAEITETAMTTTLGHNARSNGTIEVFWRYWNRCMRMLSDAQYTVWPTFRARIVFAYNTAPHQSIGGASPYEIYFGVPARDTFSKILVDSTETLPQQPNADGDEENARLFAAAIKTSTAAFIQLATNHDLYVRNETAELLNDTGFPRVFVVGALVKARFPPTQAELEITERRSNHVSAWRGPCRVVDRLSSTTYRITQLDNERQYERAISNLLPWRATSSKRARNAQFDADYDPFTVVEFIALRDEPKSWFFFARVAIVQFKTITVHYYGSKSADLRKVKFLPSWHREHDDSIRLSTTQPKDHIRYSGIVNLDSLRFLLVARKLNLTASATLTAQARRLLMPLRDELFTYE